MQDGARRGRLGAVPHDPPDLLWLYVVPAGVVEDDEGGWAVAGHPLGRDEAVVAEGVVAELGAESIGIMLA